MRPPGTGRPRCWVTGPPGGSCSATPSSSWPRNTDSGHGITPLESAIYFGRPQMVDLLAEHGIVPAALWTYAACGRLDLVRACFDADGRLRPDAALSRPDKGERQSFLD